MIRRKYHLFAFLLLLNFVGQATVANAMRCQMDTTMMDSTMMDMDHSTMNHSMSTASVSETEQVMSMDCCQNNGNCSMMGCVVVAVPVNIEFNTHKIYTESVQPLKVLTAIQIPLSLYRPPIST